VGFEMRKKERFKSTERFVEWIKNSRRSQSSIGQSSGKYKKVYG